MKTFVKAEPLGIYQIQTQILTGFSTVKQYVVHVVPSTWTFRISLIPKAFESQQFMLATAVVCSQSSMPLPKDKCKHFSL